jgi:hypothetical protein
VCSPVSGSGGVRARLDGVHREEREMEHEHTEHVVASPDRVFAAIADP